MTSGTSSAPNVCCLSTPTKEAWRKAERQEGWKDVKRWHATYCVWECRWKISRKPLESQKKKLRNTSDKSCSNKKRREVRFSPFLVATTLVRRISAHPRNSWVSLLLMILLFFDNLSEILPIYC